jgi:hypothetical protein
MRPTENFIEEWLDCCDSRKDTLDIEWTYCYSEIQNMLNTNELLTKVLLSFTIKKECSTTSEKNTARRITYFDGT